MLCLHDDSQTCDSLLEMSLGLMQMSAEPYDDISDRSANTSSSNMAGHGRNDLIKDNEHQQFCPTN